MANIELQYSALDSFVARLKTIDGKYASACTQLGKSLDWGSKACQYVWQFSGKEVAFNTIATVNSKMKVLKNEANPSLIRFISCIDSLYESANIRHNNNKNWLQKIFKFGWIVSAIVPPHILSTVLGTWSALKFAGWLANHIKPQVPAAPQIGSGLGISTFVPAVTATASAVVADVQTSAGTQKEILKKGQVLSDIWRGWSAYSPNGFTNINGKGNCTWYADNRWSQMNPDNPLRFTRTTNRNAGSWDDAIDRNYFDVNAINANTVRENAIAVRDQGKGYPYGHVAYIEQVKDGMVYYTEDGESYTRPHTWAKNADGSWQGPTVQCCSVADFQRKFNKIITSK